MGYVHGVTSEEPPPPKVLTLDAVRWSIEVLHDPYIHELFTAYLHIRQRGIESGSMSSIVPLWSEVSDLLRVPGGPPNKPHYRPFVSRGHQYWLNENIAGSFAPSSGRQAQRFMLNAAGNGFDLPADHATQALNTYLRGKRVPAWALGGYFLRNYGFDPAASEVGDLVDGFRRVFRFDSADQGTDFDILFTTGGEPDIDWFEPWRGPADDGKAAADA